MQGSAETSASLGHESDPESHVDGCLCDIAVGAADITDDADLPAASGGLGLVPVQSEGEDQLDGCDIDFLAHAATGDEELPVATGGCG